MHGKHVITRNSIFQLYLYTSIMDYHEFSFWKDFREASPSIRHTSRLKYYPDRGTVSQSGYVGYVPRSIDLTEKKIWG